MYLYIYTQGDDHNLVHVNYPEKRWENGVLHTIVFNIFVAVFPIDILDIPNVQMIAKPSRDWRYPLANVCSLLLKMAQSK